jgi:hypothetical protein
MWRQLCGAIGQELCHDRAHDTALLLITILRIKGDRAQTNFTVRKWLKMVVFYIKLGPPWGLSDCTSAGNVSKRQDQMWTWTFEERPQWKEFLKRIASCILAIVEDLGELEQAGFTEWFIMFHAIIASRLRIIAEASRAGNRRQRPWADTRKLS